MHTGGRSLARRALTQGYRWLTVETDATSAIRPKNPPTGGTFAAPKEPLAVRLQWGLDIVGPLTTAPGGFKFLITATDYFTKWVEVEPLVTIEDSDLKHFG